MPMNLFDEFENIRNTPNLEDRYDTLELYQAILRKNELFHITKEKALDMVQIILEELNNDDEPIDYIVDNETNTSFQVDSVYFRMVRDIANVYPSEVLAMINTCTYSQRQWNLYNGLLYARKQMHQTKQVRSAILPMLIENTILRQSKGHTPSAIDQRYVPDDLLPAYVAQYQQRIQEPPHTWPKAWKHQFDAIRYIHQTYNLPSSYMDPLLECCHHATTFQACLSSLMDESKDPLIAIELSHET